MKTEAKENLIVTPLMAPPVNGRVTSSRRSRSGSFSFGLLCANMHAIRMRVRSRTSRLPMGDHVIAFQAAPVVRGPSKFVMARSVTQQCASNVAPFGCDVLRCAGQVIACAAVCNSGIGTPGCIACLGSAYERCKDCF